MRRSLVTGLSLAFLAAAAPAFGGTVYLPYATDGVTVSGVTYKTQIWASNRGTENRRFSTFFVAAGADGMDRDGIEAGSVTVLGGSSVLVQGLTGANQVGMLEISGAPQLAITAQLIPTGDFAGRVGGTLPVISSENLIPAGSTAYVQALSRNSQQVSDFVLANVAKEPASCSVSAFAANGTPIGSPAQVPVQALSMNRYTDVLGILGQVTANGVRLTVTCDRTFYAFGVTFDSSNGAVNVLGPSEQLTSTLAAPGSEPPPPPPPPCEGGVRCFQRLGVFFIPTSGEPYRRETFVVPEGSYSKVHMRVEVISNGWKNPTNGLHMLWWLAINRHFRLLGFAAARGPGDNNVLFRHGMNIEATQKPKANIPFTMLTGQTYVNDFTYDAENRTLEYRITDLAGNVLLERIDRTNVGSISIEEDEDITADFSFHLGANPNEPPTFGWKYQNLTIELYD